MAVSNSALINMIMASRIVYGMADQGIVSGVFGRVLPGRRTPFVAIVSIGLIADTAFDDLATFGRAAALAVGAVLWVVNRVADR
jgi:basic amino acid/polyamine antiporter, APA family